MNLGIGLFCPAHASPKPVPPQPNHHLYHSAMPPAGSMSGTRAPCLPGSLSGETISPSRVAFLSICWLTVSFSSGRTTLERWALVGRIALDAYTSHSTSAFFEPKFACLRAQLPCCFVMGGCLLFVVSSVGGSKPHPPNGVDVGRSVRTVGFETALGPFLLEPQFLLATSR